MGWRNTDRLSSGVWHGFCFYFYEMIKAISLGARGRAEFQNQMMIPLDCLVNVQKTVVVYFRIARVNGRSRTLSSATSVL